MLEKMEYGSVKCTFYLKKIIVIEVLLYANAACLDERKKEGGWIIFILRNFANKFYISPYNIFKTKHQQRLS